MWWSSLRNPYLERDKSFPIATEMSTLHFPSLPRHIYSSPSCLTGTYNKAELYNQGVRSRRIPRWGSCELPNPPCVRVSSQQAHLGQTFCQRSSAPPRWLLDSEGSHIPSTELRRTQAFRHSVILSFCRSECLYDFQFFITSEKAYSQGKNNQVSWTGPSETHLRKITRRGFMKDKKRFFPFLF